MNGRLFLIDQVKGYKRLVIPIGNEDEHKKERMVALKGSLQQGIQNEIKGR